MSEIELARKIEALERQIAQLQTIEQQTIVLNVKNFGARGDGVTDDTAAIQAALDVNSSAGRTRSITVVFPAGEYVITSPLNLCNRAFITIQGQGGQNWGTTIVGKCSNKAMLEIIGSKHITINNIMLTGDETNAPSLAIWCARSTAVAGVDTSFIHFNEIYVYGHFRQAAYYNCGCESVRFRDSHIFPLATTYNIKAGAMFDYRNTLALVPDNTTLDTTYDQVWSRFDSCAIITNSATPAGSFSPIYVRAGYGPNLNDCYLVSYDGPIYYGLGGIRYMDVCNSFIEGTPTYHTYIEEDATYNTPGKVNEMNFINAGMGSAGSSGYSIYFEDNMIYRNSVIDSDFASDLRVYAMESVRVKRYGDYNSITNPDLYIEYYAKDSYIHVGYGDTLTFNYPNDITSTIIDDMNIGVGVHRLNTGLQMRSALATLGDMATDTDTWNPGSLADGASESMDVTITDWAVTNLYDWVCFATLSTMPNTSWQISAHPVAGPVVRVVITNHTGGTVDLGSGTVRVVAMKVT